MTKILSKQDIQLHHMASTCTFPLFWHGDRLFRSYIPTQENRFKKILSLNLPEIQEAVETDFLVDLSELSTLVDQSKIQDFIDFTHLYGCAPVYEHKNYIHRVRIQETHPELMKKVISTVCDMNAKLVEHNMIAVDVHESNINITIDGVKWLDYGSIKELDGYLTARSFVEVAYLISKYLLLKNLDIRERTNITHIRSLDPGLSIISNLDFSKGASWYALKDYTNRIPTSNLKSTHWSDEYALVTNIDDPEKYNTKSKNYWDLLHEIEFDTVTDAGCNKGYFGFLAAKKAKSMVGFDIDVKCIYKAYEQNETFKLPAIFAVKTIDEMIGNKNFESDRYKSDLVVLLAMVHHLKIQKIPEKDIVQMLDSICKRYIIIEDIDSAKDYEKLFIQHGYELVKRIDSSPSPRTLSLYRKL